jgi:hypothetical protein
MKYKRKLKKEKERNTGSNRELNQLFIKEIKKGRRICLFCYPLLFLLDCFNVFILNSIASPTEKTLAGFLYSVLIISFLTVFMKVTELTIHIPGWAIIVPIAILMVIRVPFLGFFIILTLDFMIYRNLKKMEQTAARG